MPSGHTAFAELYNLRESYQDMQRIGMLRKCLADHALV